MKIVFSHVFYTYPPVPSKEKISKSDAQSGAPLPEDEAETFSGRQVLQDFSFWFDSSRPTLLLGPSGIGKTTVVRLAAGLLKPDSGTVSGITPNTRVAVTFQEDRLFDPFTVYGNWKLAVPSLNREQASAMAVELGIGEVLDEKPASLSGGMKRRAAVGRSLLFPAEVLLLDEPFAGLDPDSAVLTQKAILAHCSGKALLVVSHQEKDAQALGARIVRLE